MIHCVIFDFDGTLVDSNHIKTSVFLDMASRFENGFEVMSEILSAPEAGDRYEIFDRFVAQIQQDSGDYSQMSSDLAKAYSERCHKAIADAPEIPGASVALHQLAAAGIQVFISSATPADPLVKLVEARQLSKLVNGVFGGPSSKESHINEIRRMTSLDASEILYVGDADSDRRAAASANVRFIAVNPCGGQSMADAHNSIESLVGFFDLVMAA